MPLIVRVVLSFTTSHAGLGVGFAQEGFSVVVSPDPVPILQKSSQQNLWWYSTMCPKETSRKQVY